MDKNNLWLDAVNTEDDGNLSKATFLYLKDAKECWERGLRGRAALSCSCAASCLSKTSNWKYAVILYREAARIYEQNAYSVIDKSIRESLWSLQHAYENFILTSDNDKAEEVFQKYVSISAKISPFFGKEEAMKMLGFRQIVVAASSSYKANKSVVAGAQSSSTLSSPSSSSVLRTSDNDNIRRSIDAFLELSGSEVRCEDIANDNISARALRKEQVFTVNGGNDDSSINSKSTDDDS
jgi:hypothetical protein